MKTAKLPLMPKATAIWLVDNTSLSFRQIGDFCGMHELEIKGIADGEVGVGCLLYTSPSPRDGRISRMPSSA